MIDISKLTIKKTREHYLKGDFSPQELIAESLRMAKEDSNLNAYRELFEDELEKSRNIIINNNSPILSGIPIAVKDNILIKDRIAGASSKILENYVAPYDAKAISNLKTEGAIFIGRTNCDEFAMGGSTENSAYGPTKNPNDQSRVAGGSSGGSAAAVAAGSVVAALGSDTGGSVREPASFCGVVGMKPTYGGISRYGLMAMGSSLDQIGPFAKTVEDAEILFNIMKGKDPMDSTSVDIINNSQRPKIIGVPFHLFEKGVDVEVMANLNDLVKKMEGVGYIIKDINLPYAKYALSIYYIIMPAEVSSNMARYDGMKFGERIPGKDLLDEYMNTRGELFGKEVRRRIILGTYVLSSGYYDAYYGQAMQARELMKKDFRRIFEDEKIDAVLTPTAPTPAFKIGEKISDPLSMYLADVFTVTANIIGAPAISVPSGCVVADGKNLPLGLQFMAKPGNDHYLWTLAKSIEELR